MSSHPLDSQARRAERLRSLSFWPGPIAVEPISGGITNHNFLVTADSRRYVARLSVERYNLGIDRRNEVLCQRAAHTLGVAPAVSFQEEGVLVSEHVPGRVLKPDDLRDPGVILRLADVLRPLHDGWDRLIGELLYFSPFQTVATYTQTARDLGASLPDDVDPILLDARRLARQIAPFTPVLCHNDLLPSNIIDDGDRLTIVDWEYAGIGHPLFDLAGLAANGAYTPDLETALLTAYRQSPPSPQDLRELRILKTISLLREALWSVIQAVASDIPFDFATYAHVNFGYYRDARRRLEL